MKQMKHENSIIKEHRAFIELKNEIVKLMFDFTNKYSSKGENCIYPHAGQILVDVLVACLSEAHNSISSSNTTYRP